MAKPLIHHIGTTGLANGYYLAKVLSGELSLEAYTPPATVPWTKTLDLPLSTLTGWTAGAGAWSITSGVIRQATTTAAVYRLRYTAARVRTSQCVLEVDVRMASASGVSSRVGVVFGAGFTSDTTNGYLTAPIVNAGATLLSGMNWEVDAVTAGPVITLPSTVAFNTYARLKIMKNGSDSDAFLDGVYVGSAVLDQPNREQGTIALYAYGADVSFRNLELWTPDLPT